MTIKFKIELLQMYHKKHGIDLLSVPYLHSEPGKPWSQDCIALVNSEHKHLIIPNYKGRREILYCADYVIALDTEEFIKATYPLSHILNNLTSTEKVLYGKTS